MLIWEELPSETDTGQREFMVYRARVPGGWFVAVWQMSHDARGNTFFYADPDHGWDGGSLPA